MAGAPQVGSSARRRAKLGRLPLADRQVAGDGADGQRVGGDGRAADAAATVRVHDGDRIGPCRAYRDAVGGLAGAPQVGSSARRRAELGRLPLADRHVAGNGADGQRVDGDYNMI